MDQFDQGYEDKRFQTTVDGNFHCPICLNVLKDPVQCRRNEHYFCTPCIVRHIQQNAQSCPVCTEPLTTKTLREPSRIVVSYLASLKIACEYTNQGCPAVLSLSQLKQHTTTCDFAPVACSIEGCRALVCRRDKKHHETQLCKFRKVKCSVCGKKVFQRKYNTHGCALKQTIVELKDELVETKDEVSVLKQQVRKSNERQLAQETKIHEMEKTITELRQGIRGVTTRQPKTTWDIIVIGGHDGTRYLNSAEMLNRSTKSWESLPSMIQARLAPSAFIYQDNIIVTGGFAGSSSTDTMERMNMRQESKQWMQFQAKLPFKGNRHSCVVYENRLFIIGGEDGDRNQISDGIYEVLLTSPVTTRLVGRMPQPRVGHNTILYDEKVIIIGGRTTNRFKDALRSVLVYDVKDSQCKEVEPLPFEVSQMASVRHGDSVLIMGGQDKEGNVLDKFFVYNIKTGRSKLLPGMNEKREALTAVVKKNEVIVMGGRDEKKRYLKTVECFDFDRQVWEKLPSMSTARMHATSLANNTS